MKTHNIPFQLKQSPKIILNLQPDVFSQGTQERVQIAMVNEPSVFESLKVYCTNKVYRESASSVCNSSYSFVHCTFYDCASHSLFPKGGVVG